MGMIEKLAARRKAATKGSGEARRALSELRAMGARLRDQRADVENRPVPLKQAQMAASEAVLREAAQAMDDLNVSSLVKPGDGRKPTLRLTAQGMAALAFVANADGVAAAVNARLEERYRHMPAGMSADDRAAELARIDAELLACELAEESVIRELERDGAAPLRRPDADPRALLADDSHLK